MEIFVDSTLTESAHNEGGMFTLDMGVCQAGESMVKEFYIKNPKDADLREIHMTLKPVVEMVEGRERDYTKCLQEITIKHFPKHLKAFESQRFEIHYAPNVEFLRGLKFNMEISAKEYYS